MKFKNSSNFQWVGEGVPIHFQKRKSKIRYEAFNLGDVKIGVGDFVLVRNDDALDPEDIMSCYVAQVKSLFDSGDDLDPFQAQVQWFSRVLELPTYIISLFKNVGNEHEIVKDKRSSWHDMIDAETIFQKCEVIFFSPDTDFEFALSKYNNHPFPVFFCRYVFTGTSLIEVKDKSLNKPVNFSIANGNSDSNAFVSLNENKTQNTMICDKNKSLQKADEMYYAFSIGSPSKIPRVVIKKIDDKILESQNGNIRIFVADSNVEKIEDVADIFLSKLKLEKEAKCSNNLEKKPVIHNLSSQDIFSEKNIYTKNTEFVDYDSNIKSETANTPKAKRISSRINDIPLNTKISKSLFTYNTRNSPRKNIAIKKSTVNSTPTKKPRIATLDELKLKHSCSKVSESSDEGEENILEPRPEENKWNRFEKNSDISISKNNKFKDDTPKIYGDMLSDSVTKTLPRKNIAVKKSNVNSTPTKKPRIAVLDELKHSCPKMSESSDEGEENILEENKWNRTEKNSDTFISKNNNFEDDTCKIYGDIHSDSVTKSFPKTYKTRKSFVNKETATPVHTVTKHVPSVISKKSPDKYAALKNSNTYSTPKKKAKFTDIHKDVCVTRSGRRVKVVNYSEEKYETSIISTVTPSKKKMPHFIRASHSDDSDSDKFTASDHSSDDDSSLSGHSLIDEISPAKSKHLLKKKNKTVPKHSRSTLNVRTPTSRKNTIDLYIPERKTPLRTPKNALEESRQRLHVSAVPNSLPCRDDEYSDIYSFVRGCLCSQTGGCMYISGVPGTGKTATVHEVMRNLEEEKESGDIPIFTFVEVNGMWMTDPYQCYVQIFKALTGKSIAPQQAAELLEKRFTERRPKKDAVVLLVDELDRLWTRKQTVMYNIFDWPTKNNSKLIVLAIANTMDLPERMMMNRISSRLGLTRKTFQPYTFKQLQEIIMSRIQELKLFDPDAVQLVARKVAAVSGDARRALDICRFATETIKVGQTAKKGQKVVVGMEQVDIALQQMFSSPVISAIRSSSKIAKLFFQCILSEFTRTGLEEATLLKVHQQVISICRFEGFHPPNSTAILGICADLAASHLILIDNFKNDLYMKIRLNVSTDDVTYALTLK